MWVPGSGYNDRRSRSPRRVSLQGPRSGYHGCSLEPTPRGVRDIRVAV
jgi:hypothetical protein